MRTSLNDEPVADSNETSASVPSPVLSPASRSMVVPETADSSDTVSVPVPPSRPSSPPRPLTTSLPPRPADGVRTAVSGERIGGGAAREVLELEQGVGAGADRVLRDLVEGDGDRGGGRRVVGGVAAAAAGERVVPQASGQPVVPVQAADDVGRSVAGQRVVERRALHVPDARDGVGARPAGVLRGGHRQRDGDAAGGRREAQGVGARATPDRVVRRGRTTGRRRPGRPAGRRAASAPFRSRGRPPRTPRRRRRLRSPCSSPRRRA